MFENKRRQSLTYDEEEIDGFIRDNYAQIYKYCFYHVGNREDAQDLTQEVFMKFLRGLENYREYGKVRNYLYVAAKNLVTDYFRKHKEACMEEAIEEPCGGGMEKVPERIDILQALNTLEAFEKELIILRYYQELRIRDIAQILDMPASTVRYKLKNAEKRLKDRLEV